MSALEELHQLYMGPIPPAAQALARFGSPSWSPSPALEGGPSSSARWCWANLRPSACAALTGAVTPPSSLICSCTGSSFEAGTVSLLSCAARWAGAIFITPIQQAQDGHRLAKGAPMNPMLQHSLAEHEYLRQRLKAEFPDADEETLRDTLEGLSSLPEMLACVLRSYLDDIALAAALGIRINDMQERISRFEQRAEKKRALIISVMERADLKKLAEPDFTVSFRTTAPSLVITAEVEIPQDFWKPQPAKLDRQGLTAALRGGRSVPGAVLSNGQATISVRTR